MKSFRLFYYGSVRMEKACKELTESGENFSLGTYSYRGAKRAMLKTYTKNGKRILDDIR